MEFEYSKREWHRGTLYIPTLPLMINGFPVGHVMIDTGSDVTLLPMELSEILDVELDKDSSIRLMAANGDEFIAIPSKRKVEYCMEKGGFRPIFWKGTVFFSKDEPTILLGQFECLSELKITLDGKRRRIRVEQQI